ncbi:DciA family protein [Streptomyces sp. NPDC001212]|uniref:DciA family protein n=1 Tax=Streptomyces sp. CoT10 TaxID=2875762 RepID=UPI001CD714E6|nr:DciA family protein [Streptomyces sp. CoT10]
MAAAISPQLPHHVTAAAFHPETGQLNLRPDSPAYATQLRLIAARIVATVNSAVGTDAVRTVRLLPVGAAPAARTPQASYERQDCLSPCGPGSRVVIRT